MIQLTSLLAVATMATMATIVTVHLMIRDGRGSQHPPASHIDDVRFRSPTSR